METETNRLVLRQVKLNDIDKVVEFCLESESLSYILKGTKSAEYIIRFMNKVVEHSQSENPIHFYRAVVLKSTGDFIGCCNLSNAITGQVSMLGWHFSRSFAGRGYATEAAKELLRFGFEKRGVSSVYADCFESNKAAVRVMEKLGMLPIKNLWLRKYLFAVTYREYRAIVRWSISAPAR